MFIFWRCNYFILVSWTYQKKFFFLDSKNPILSSYMFRFINCSLLKLFQFQYLFILFCLFIAPYIIYSLIYFALYFFYTDLIYSILIFLFLFDKIVLFIEIILINDLRIFLSIIFNNKQKFGYYIYKHIKYFVFILKL